MEMEYIIAFSSFYKAAYAHDMLEEEGITLWILFLEKLIQSIKKPRKSMLR